MDYINTQTERLYAKTFHLHKFSTCRSICIGMPFTSEIEFFLRLNAISEHPVCMTPSDQLDQPCRWLCVARCKASLGQQVNNVKLHKVATCNLNLEKLFFSDMHYPTPVI